MEIFNMPRRNKDPTKQPRSIVAQKAEKYKKNLLGEQSTGLAQLILNELDDVSRSDQEMRSQFINEKFESGGKGFVERVKKYGHTEDDEKLIIDPWLEELLEVIGDFRVGHTITVACSQLSKAQPLDADVLTPVGWRQMGDLKVGDEVIAADGTPTKITHIHPQGVKEVHQVLFDDGSWTECCNDHLWLTQTPNERRSKDPIRRKGHVRSLKQIRESLYRTKDDGSIIYSKAGSPNSMHSIQYAEPVQLTKKELGIHPYIMGVLLGDGSLTVPGQVTFSTPDEQIHETVADLLPEHLHLLKISDDICSRICAEQGYHSRFNNDVINEIRKQGLEGKGSLEKFIPEDYLYSSIEDRLWLLKGLMDTDGWICCNKKENESTKQGNGYYGSSSFQLIQDVWHLVLSLGGNPKPISSNVPTYTHKGRKLLGSTAYKFVFSLPGDMNPFHLERKASKYIRKDNNGAWKRFIREINFSRAVECQCITIDHPSHLYVTDDYLVTHNSLSHILLACDTQASGRLVFAYVFDKKQTLSTAQPTQFKPCLENWVSAMVPDGISFNRENDKQSQLRNELGGVNSIFTYASTSDQTQRGAQGKSAVGSALAGFKTDLLLQEERSLWPVGASDVCYRRVDASRIDSKPVRDLGTPGAGLGIEMEMKNADHHFYPHFRCEECGDVSPLDPFGCLLKSFSRTNSFGQLTESYVSESNRPVHWHHKDPDNVVESAYFGCPNCGEEIPQDVRVSAKFRCKKTGTWLRDFLDSLPKGIPEKRYKVVIHYGPLMRRSRINLAADLIRNGLEMSDASDWIQQGLGHPSDAGSSNLTIPILTRAIHAPEPVRKPELRLAGIDQGRNGFWTTIMDVSLPNGWKDKPLEIVVDSAIRQIYYAEEVPMNQIESLLKEHNVMFGCIDNEPNRTVAAELQRVTNLVMVDQRSGLSDAFKKDFVMEGGMEIPCYLVRNEKFMMQAMRGFLLTEHNKDPNIRHPLTRLPNDWERWIVTPTELSPLRHYMGVECDPLTGKWKKTDTANGLYYALMMAEAGMYIWLSRGGSEDAYIPGSLTNTIYTTPTSSLDTARSSTNSRRQNRFIKPVRRRR